MNKKEKNSILMDKYIKKMFIIGFVALMCSLLFLIYKANSSKSQIALNFLNSYINKDFIFDDKTLYYKYKAKTDFNCSTYITIDSGLKSKTTCSIEQPSLVFYSGEKEDNIVSLDKLELSLNSGLFVTQIPDFFKNGFSLKVKADSINIEDIILNNGLNVSKESLSLSGQENLIKIFKEFKNLNLKGIAEIKPLNVKDKFFNVSINGDILGNNWGLKQNINFNFIQYDKPKEVLFKSTITEEDSKTFDSPTDSITELKIVLPTEMFVNKNYMAFSATNGKENLIDIFYSYYKIMFETKINKNEYNKFYLDIDTDQIVDIETFKSRMKELTNFAATEYELTVNAPLTVAIKNLFAGNYGSCYKTEVLDPNKNISIQYLIELMKKDPVEGNSLSKNLYNRTILECTLSAEDCFKKCDN